MRTGTTPLNVRSSARVPAILLMVLFVALLLAPAGPAVAQPGGSSPPATVPPIDDETRDLLRDIFGSDSTDADSEAISSSFTSDEFGFTVSYSSPWSYDGWWTLEGLTTHYLSLQGTQSGIYISGWDWPGEATVREYVAWWADPAYIEEWMPGGEALRFTATETTGAVVHISAPTEDYPEPWVYVTELHLAGSYAIEVIFFSPISEFTEAYEAAVGVITANDELLFDMFGLEEIEAMLPATGAFTSPRTGARRTVAAA